MMGVKIGCRIGGGGGSRVTTDRKGGASGDKVYSVVCELEWKLLGV